MSKMPYHYKEIYYSWTDYGIYIVTNTDTRLHFNNKPQRIILEKKKKAFYRFE